MWHIASIEKVAYHMLMYHGLVPFLLLAVVAAVLFLLIKVFHSKRHPRVYRPKGPYLLSPGENMFFEALSHVVPEDVYICPKVRVADLLEVTFERSDPEHWRYFSAISQKHVDFVLCRRSDFAPLLVIELDGGSHREKTRMERDRIVDNAFKDAGIPFIHIRSSGFYEYSTLKEKVVQAIGG